MKILTLFILAVFAAPAADLCEKVNDLKTKGKQPTGRLFTAEFVCNQLRDLRRGQSPDPAQTAAEVWKVMVMEGFTPKEFGHSVRTIEQLATEALEQKTDEHFDMAMRYAKDLNARFREYGIFGDGAVLRVSYHLAAFMNAARKFEEYKRRSSPGFFYDTDDKVRAVFKTSGLPITMAE